VVGGTLKRLIINHLEQTPYIDGPDQMLVGIHPESDVDDIEYEVIPDYCHDLE